MRSIRPGRSTPSPSHHSAITERTTRRAIANGHVCDNPWTGVPWQWRRRAATSDQRAHNRRTCGVCSDIRAIGPSFPADRTASPAGNRCAPHDLPSAVAVLTSLTVRRGSASALLDDRTGSAPRKSRYDIRQARSTVIVGQDSWGDAAGRPFSTAAKCHARQVRQRGLALPPPAW